MVKVKDEKDVAGRHVQASPAVLQRWAVGGQGCAAPGHGYGARVFCCNCHVVPSQVVPEGVREWPEEAEVAGGGGGGSWGGGPRAVVGVEVSSVGAVVDRTGV